MRLRAKVDANQKEIVKALRAGGCSVQILAQVGHGVPDLLIGFRGVTDLAEVKDGDLPPSARKLTQDEQSWISAWRGRRVLLLKSLDDVKAYFDSMQNENQWNQATEEKIKSNINAALDTMHELPPPVPPPVLILSEEDWERLRPCGGSDMDGMKAIKAPKWKDK